MLRVVAHTSAAAAQQYYAKGLRREDYYLEGQELAGKWYGKAATRLGLSGSVTPEGFAALVENRHPGTGERLTARTKSSRTVGYDLNFHAPKSLSLLHALTGDKALVGAFREAVAETMAEIEAQVATRVRQRGAQTDKVTGNLAWAEFVHFTSRPVGGIPDPHLHVHCFAFNATFDADEERWKAAKFLEIKKSAPYSEAVFHAHLADKLKALGYGIERTRFGWEIAGVPRDLIERFSRRTAQIDRLAAERGITDAKKKDGLGAESREGKRRGLSSADLKAAWEARLNPDEKALFANLRIPSANRRSPPLITAAEAMDYACAKLFAKHSVVEQKRLVGEALRFGVGHLTPEAAWREFNRREMIVRKIGGETLCTSLDVLGEEVSLINFVRTGRGMHAALNDKEPDFKNAALAAELRAAVRHLLTSRDQVIGIRGVAGAGKTTLMSEAVPQIEATGVKVFAFAPSASSSRGTLRESGFANAETVAHLLVNKKLQEQTRGHVIWIDEAGTLGVADMWEIMKIAGNGTRVILTGDTAQHAPVARGDAFRLMQSHAGLKVAEVTQIRRQEHEDYRKAVAALSKGDLRTAFRRLDELGAIVEVENDDDRYRLLASDFLDLSRHGQAPLVVSPTHAEGAKVTAAIRDAKREAGLLGPEKTFVQFHNLQWEEADRGRAENYREGLVVQFHQNVHGIRRGELFRVTGQGEAGEVRAVNDAGRTVSLPLKDAARFQVFEEREIALARGDRIRITRNCSKCENGRRLNNGDVFTVEKISADGKIVLDSGAVLGAKHGHLTYGYCQTSHSAQSKSVRDVLVAQSADSFLASSREQFYVSVSRGKQSIRIYTDDRQGLQEAVGGTSTRRAGVELAGFTRRDLSSLMSELNGRQWRDMIQSRSAEGAAKNHVQNLLRERKQDASKKTEAVDFRQYVQMRRGLAGSDGKSRSKGHPSGDAEKKANIQNRGRSFLRPTELTTATKEKVAAANATKQPAAAQAQKPAATQTRLDRVANGYRAAKEHFKKVSEKVKGTFEGRAAKRLPQSNVEQVARHGMKQRAADAGSMAKQHVKAQQKAPAPAPVRRGR